MNTEELKGKKIAMLATNGFEHSELFKPKSGLEARGADVHVISLEKEDIKSWKDGNWGETVSVDRTVDEASGDEYHALVIPGGVINPDILRTNDKALDFVRSFFEDDKQKPVAAVCHGPWVLIEAGVMNGRKATSYPSIKTDMVNAGVTWTDESVVCDKALITSRNPDDLDDFINKIVEEVKEGRHKIPERAQNVEKTSTRA